MFVDKNNTVYVLNRQENKIFIWNNNSVYSREILFDNITNPLFIFITNIREIYINHGSSIYQVDRWIPNTNSSVVTMIIDNNNTLYCSILNHHEVIKVCLNDNITTPTIAAGTGNPGSGPNELAGPMGILVDENFDVYVTEYRNNQIQLFSSGQLNGKTVAGDGSADVTITLNCPSGLTMDADKHLFIVDKGNHRIIGSGIYGYRCIAGCDGPGFYSYNLFDPWVLHFNNAGNLFVTDHTNYRIQKFLLLPNSCSKWIKYVLIKIVY